MERPGRRRRPPRPARWLQEAGAIVLLAGAAFALVAVATVDPTGGPEQRGPTGPVGAWVGWVLRRGFGYAGGLPPLLGAALGLGLLLRPRSRVGWASLAGAGLVLVAVTGLLAEAVAVMAPEPSTLGGPGGLLGDLVARALRAALGGVGAWLVLLAGLAVGGLFVTQRSCAALPRVLRRWRRGSRGPREPAAREGATADLPAAPPRAEAAPGSEEAPPLPLVVEPRRRPESPTGLAWQESFDFGQGGAEAFQLPPLGLLQAPSDAPPLARETLQENAETLRRKLQDFEAEGRIVQVTPGPVITSYEFEPAPGVKISRVVNLADDLALALKAASVRIVGPIPGRGTVAIEVPNPEPALVYLREILASADFAASRHRLPLALGKDVTGQPVVADLAAMPHLLVAGATGTGKSVGLNAMILSILFKMTPAEVRFLMVDPKRLELTAYEGIPHLLAPVVVDAREAAARLRWIVGKMDERYRLLQGRQVRNIEGYNRTAEPAERLPYWVVVIDELADLMMVSAGEVQTSLVRLAQLARAIGIHLIVATQRPSVDVVTGLIKANFPTRIAFQMASRVDSRTVLDANGAEQLLGRGDMIFVPPGANRHLRVHGAWVSDEEVRAVCDFLRAQGTAVYEPADLGADGASGGEGAADPERDELYWECVRLVVAQRQASISFLQRRMGLGYPKAARFIDMMEQDRIIGPGQGAKPREILVGPEFLARLGK
jgi:S-DNA-T family DNA segregation ATPase FtsK/SpoIIIE